RDGHVTGVQTCALPILAGSYGTYTFNPTTGAWSYTLNQALADPLTAGQIVHDHLVVTSFDGTATHDIDVTITGSNDNATITVTGSEDTAVLEAGGRADAHTCELHARGPLVCSDLVTGENHFHTPVAPAGSYGTYTFNPTSAACTYTLHQPRAPTLTLFPYTTLFRSVTSFDGTATHDIDVTITGSNDNATITVTGSEDTAVLEAGG